MTNSINEIEQAQVILISGSNTTRTHPQVARRFYRAVDRGAKLIVIDPRRTRLARHAHIHLRIRPGTDIALLNGMMRSIIDENLIDDLFIQMRTENYTTMRDMLFGIDLAQAAAITGVPEQTIRRAARIYAQAQRSVICYCLGVTQHIAGTGNVQSYANLAMLTGHVEQEFTGVDPLRGQNNVQGACDMGALPGVLPGYQSVFDDAVREKFARVWGVELPATPGLTLLDMTHEAGGGATGLPQAAPAIRALYVTGENPLLSEPSLNGVKKAFHQYDFLVVSDIFLSETAQVADVVFPAASFAEKTGTITSSERRVQLMRKAIEPVGDSRPDDWIVMELARRMGHAMDYESPAEVMEEICMVTPIYGGMYHDRLDREWGVQWPCGGRDMEGTQYLHKYSFARGRGRFEPAAHVEPAEPTDSDYPFALITGRFYFQYHTGTMTRRTPILERESGQPLLEMHPDDGRRLGLRPGSVVTVASRRGRSRFVVELTDRVAPGNLFTSFHFAEAPVNELTIDASDPVARCPEYKVCAVRLEDVEPC